MRGWRHSTTTSILAPDGPFRVVISQMSMIFIHYERKLEVDPFPKLLFCAVYYRHVFNGPYQLPNASDRVPSLTDGWMPQFYACFVPSLPLNVPDWQEGVSSAARMRVRALCSCDTINDRNHLAASSRKVEKIIFCYSVAFP